MERENRIRKVRQDQRGLGPRLRVSRRAVGAKARFRAQRAIPRYTSRGGSNLTVPGQFHHCHVLDLLRGRIVVGDHGCEVIAVHDACDWNE